jgi:hypothetical protein
VGKQPPRRRAALGGWGEPLVPRSLEHWRFQWHEEVLKRHDLKRSPIAVAGALMHAFNPTKGYAELGFTTLAKRAGCCVNTAKAAIRKLEANGLVAVTNRGQRGADGSLQRHRYKLVYASRGVTWCEAPSEDISAVALEVVRPIVQ